VQNLAVKTLRKTLTREEFKDRIYLKSRSTGSKSVLECSLKNFDEFCEKEYGKKSENLIETLRENHGDELYHFLQDFINFLDHKF